MMAAQPAHTVWRVDRGVYDAAGTYECTCGWGGREVSYTAAYNHGKRAHGASTQVKRKHAKPSTSSAELKRAYRARKRLQVREVLGSPRPPPSPGLDLRTLANPSDCAVAREWLGSERWLEWGSGSCVARG
jgi:hypothetical protein